MRLTNDAFVSDQRSWHIEPAVLQLSHLRYCRYIVDGRTGRRWSCRVNASCRADRASAYSLSATTMVSRQPCVADQVSVEQGPMSTVRW